MLNFFKLFWSSYLLEFIAPIVLIAHYLTGIHADFAIKIPSILYFLIIVLFHFKNKLIVTPITILFFIGGVVGIFYGLIRGNPIDNKFISHLYFSSIPILGISFGYYYAKSFTKESSFFLFKIFNLAFIITCIILCIYFYFHFITGDIAYWGLGTEMHILVPFLLVQRKFVSVVIGVVFVILSGKRATLINILTAILMFFSAQFKSLNSKNFFKLFAIIIISVFALIWAYQQGAFSRLESSLQFDISDDEVMMYATSGRWQEITGILDHHNNNPVSWYIGAGFGGRYEWYIPLDGYLEMKHYAHFSPFAYIFLFGIPFTVLLYFFFIRNFFSSWAVISNPFVITFIVSIIGSFFGANLFVDIKIWVFAGIFMYIIKNPGSEIHKIQLNSK